MKFCKVTDKNYVNLDLVRRITQVKLGDENYYIKLFFDDKDEIKVKVEECSQELKDWLRAQDLEDLLLGNGWR